MIHMYPTVMKYLFSDVFDLSKYIDKNYCIFYLMYGTMTIFLLGIIIDTLREGIFCAAEKLRKLIVIRE